MKSLRTPTLPTLNAPPPTPSSASRLPAVPESASAADSWRTIIFASSFSIGLKVADDCERLCFRPINPRSASATGRSSQLRRQRGGGAAAGGGGAADWRSVLERRLRQSRRRLHRGLPASTPATDTSRGCRKQSGSGPVRIGQHSRQPARGGRHRRWLSRTFEISTVANRRQPCVPSRRSVASGALGLLSSR